MSDALRAHFEYDAIRALIGLAAVGLCLAVWGLSVLPDWIRSRIRK